MCLAGQWPSTMRFKIKPSSDVRHAAPIRASPLGLKISFNSTPPSTPAHKGLKLPIAGLAHGRDFGNVLHALGRCDDEAAINMHKVLFLPGAGGSAKFWQPVAQRLPDGWNRVLFNWPGLGDEPHDPAINSIDDLVRFVESKINGEINGPVDLVAQSMGGVIAVRVALSRPQIVRRLVLVATSGGVDMARFGASDWRPDYRQLYPKAADWISQEHAAAPLPVENISAPTLLIWGDADPISPVPVGRELERRVPNAKLCILSGGDHDLALTASNAVAELILEHIRD
jgi:pimeloyl-ACP methyl ester carboxylesterase